MAEKKKESLLVTQIMVSVIEAKFGEHLCWFYLLTIQVLQQSEDSVPQCIHKAALSIIPWTSDFSSSQQTTSSEMPPEVGNSVGLTMPKTTIYVSILLF